MRNTRTIVGMSLKAFSERADLMTGLIHSFHPNGSESEQVTRTWQNVEDGAWLEVGHSECLPGVSCLGSSLSCSCRAQIPACFDSSSYTTP